VLVPGVISLSGVSADGEFGWLAAKDVSVKTFQGSLDTANRVIQTSGADDNGSRATVVDRPA